MSLLQQMATQIVGSLLALEALDEEEDIRIYINSPGLSTRQNATHPQGETLSTPTPRAGGQPYSVFGVLDAIKSIKPDVQTLGLGACYSYASLILVGAATVRGEFIR
eukprot:scaffold185273_cov19-Tisochrysis_lutea.AAC.4